MYRPPRRGGYRVGIGRKVAAFQHDHGDLWVLRDQIARGGQVLVCGGTAMARAVAGEFEALLAPLGLTVATLKAEGRYLEDVY